MIQLLSEALSQSQQDRLSKWAKSEETQEFVLLLKQQSAYHILRAGESSLSLLEDKVGQEETAIVRGHASEAELYNSMVSLITDIAAGKPNPLESCKFAIV